MNMRHELLGMRYELSRKYKKHKIMADALASHINAMLTCPDYTNLDAEDLQLSSESLSEQITAMQDISIKLGKLNNELGMR